MTTKVADVQVDWAKHPLLLANSIRQNPYHSRIGTFLHLVDMGSAFVMS